MIKLACGKELAKLGIRTKEGVNITAFLDHLEDCPHCGKDDGALLKALNQVIGGEKKG